MPKIFNKEEHAMYHIEVAKLAAAQIELETEKIKKAQSELALIKARVFFWGVVGVLVVAVAFIVNGIVSSTCWDAFK